MTGERVPYPAPIYARFLFDSVTQACLEVIPYLTNESIALMLHQLHDCEFSGDERWLKQETTGATRKSIAYAGRLYGLDDADRREWMKVAESFGLTQRHVGHIIARAENPAPLPGAESGFDNVVPFVRNKGGGG